MGVIYLHKVAYGKGSGGGGGPTDYNELSNKPKINNTTLVGNKTTTDLNIADGSTITINNNEQLEVGVITSSQISDLFNP